MVLTLVYLQVPYTKYTAMAIMFDLIHPRWHIHTKLRLISPLFPCGMLLGNVGVGKFVDQSLTSSWHLAR